MYTVNTFRRSSARMRDLVSSWQLCARFFHSLPRCALHRRPGHHIVALRCRGRLVMSAFGGALLKAWRRKGLVLGLRQWRDPEAELAREVLIIGRHTQLQAHIFLEECLQAAHQAALSLAHSVS